MVHRSQLCILSMLCLIILLPAALSQAQTPAATLPATGTATAAQGFNSQPQDFVASSFSSSISTAVNQTFQWQAEPAANNTPNPSGTLNLLYGLGDTTPGETGLRISNAGLITFAPGQIFPSMIAAITTAPGSGLAGGGTAGTLNLSISAAGITNAMLANSSLKVLPGTALTGGGTVALGGSTTLSLDTTKVPLLAGANTFTGNQTVNGVLYASSVGVTSSVSGGAAVYGNNTATSSTGTNGGFFVTASPAGSGVVGVNTGSGGNDYAGYFQGNVAVTGLITFGPGQTFPGAGTITGVSPGTGLSGGGSSGNITVGIDTSVVPQLGASSNTFTGTINAKSIYGTIFGQSGSESALGSGLATSPSTITSIGPAGVYADAGSGIGSAGIIATSENGYAGYFVNSSMWATLYLQNESASGYMLQATNTATGKACQISTAGDLNCSGTKNAIVPIYGGKRKVALSAIESPQNWFEDFGSAELKNGAAVVALDPDFVQTVNTEMDYKVFPVPNGDCKGLYVTHKTATSFEVRELGGGTSSVSFDYRIAALRRNYEKVRLADHTNDPNPLQMVKNRAQK